MKRMYALEMSIFWCHHTWVKISFNIQWKIHISLENESNDKWGDSVCEILICVSMQSRSFNGRWRCRTRNCQNLFYRESLRHFLPAQHFLNSTYFSIAYFNLCTSLIYSTHRLCFPTIVIVILFEEIPVSIMCVTSNFGQLFFCIIYTY